MRGRGSLAREYTVTYRTSPRSRTRRLTAGSSGPGSRAVDGRRRAGSLESSKSIHERFAINVGDQMRFDVAGRIFDARVTSVRRVRWERLAERRLHVRLPPGRARARSAHVRRLRAWTGGAPTRGRASSTTSCREYPNVSAIDARDVIARIQAVVDNVILAVSIVGGIALASGVLILIGAVAMTKFQRVYEAAILRTLGASTRLLATMVALEYSALGLLAGLIGAVGALGLSWAVTRYLFDIAWKPEPVLLVAGAC